MRRSLTIGLLLVALSLVLVGGPSALLSPSTEDVAPETSEDPEIELVTFEGSESAIWAYMSPSKTHKKHSPLNVFVRGDSDEVVRLLQEEADGDWQELEEDEQDADADTYAVFGGTKRTIPTKPTELTELTKSEEPTKPRTKPTKSTVPTRSTRTKPTKPTKPTKARTKLDSSPSTGRSPLPRTGAKLQAELGTPGSTPAQTSRPTGPPKRYNSTTAPTTVSGPTSGSTRVPTPTTSGSPCKPTASTSTGSPSATASTASRTPNSRSNANSWPSHRSIRRRTSSAGTWTTLAPPTPMAGRPKSTWWVSSSFQSSGSPPDGARRTHPQPLEDRLTEVDKRRLAAAYDRIEVGHPILAGSIIALFLGVRVAGIALEQWATFLTMHNIAAILYPVIALGIPVATYLIARGLESRLDAAVAASISLAAAMWIDYGMVGVSSLPIDVVLQRMLVIVAIGLIAGGAARRATRDRVLNDMLLVGVAMWGLVLVGTLFGYF
ncbi:hypothetical protein ACFQMM_16815 [Saliphagus sp. GCM10025308]